MRQDSHRDWPLPSPDRFFAAFTQSAVDIVDRSRLPSNSCSKIDCQSRTFVALDQFGSTKDDWIRDLIVRVFRLGPSMESEEDYFMWLLRACDLSFAGSAFLNGLESLPHVHRPILVEKYIGICEFVFQEAQFFQKLEKMGLYSPNSGSLRFLLDFPEPSHLIADLSASSWFFHSSTKHSRATALRAIAWALGRLPEAATGRNLAQAVDAARQSAYLKKDQRPMHGARGLVRLLLFHGALVDYLTRRAVLDEAEP
jgi:hypothetical protein